MKSEAEVQNDIRVAAVQQGDILWRNNSGVLPDKHGTPVRFGLGNDSPPLNKVWASPDLVGGTQLFITQEWVGRCVLIFTGCEVKKEGWGRVSTLHEQAQAKCLTDINQRGGIGFFAQSIEDYKNATHPFKT